MKCSAEHTELPREVVRFLCANPLEEEPQRPNKPRGSSIPLRSFWEAKYLRICGELQIPLITKIYHTIVGQVGPTHQSALIENSQNLARKAYGVPR